MCGIHQGRRVSQAPNCIVFLGVWRELLLRKTSKVSATCYTSKVISWPVFSKAPQPACQPMGNQPCAGALRLGKRNLGGNPTGPAWFGATLYPLQTVVPRSSTRGQTPPAVTTLKGGSATQTSGILGDFGGSLGCRLLSRSTFKDFLGRSGSPTLQGSEFRTLAFVFLNLF